MDFPGGTGASLLTGIKGMKGVGEEPNHMIARKRKPAIPLSADPGEVFFIISILKQSSRYRIRQRVELPGIATICTMSRPL